MSVAELREHATYWTDEVKVERYRAALRAVVRPGDRVLDLGCGTGLLGLLACQAGAGRVYAVDRGDVIELARQLAEANGVADRFVFVKAMSTEVTLPEQVDVVVGDQLGGVGHDAGVNEFYADARRRHLRPGGVLVPGSYELRFAPVEDDDEWRSIVDWSRGGAGFDTSALVVASCNTPRAVRLAARDLLADPVAGATVDAADTGRLEASGVCTARRAGTMHGLAGMFEATMAPGVSMTNDPTRPDAMRQRWQTLFPLDRPVRVEPGDLVRWSYSAHPLTGLQTWRVGVEPQGAGTAHEVCGSTFLGAFLGPETFRRESPDHVPVPSGQSELWSWALAAIDGRRSVRDLAIAATERFPDRFADVAVAEVFVRRVARSVER